jgi:thioredoxin 1
MAMKKIVFFVLTYVSIHQVKAQNFIKALPPDDFSMLIQGNKKLQLIDLRTAEEYENAHIKKSFHLDLGREDADSYIDRVYNKSETLFIYCQTGYKSLQSASYFQELGFNRIYVLEGGFENWTNKSKPYTGSSIYRKPLAYLSESNFLEQIKSNRYVLVDFYATWCGPCKKMAPVLEKVDKELPQLSLVKIDADKHLTLTEKYEIEEIPTLILFKNGKQVWRQTGIIEESEIKSKLN